MTILNSNHRCKNCNSLIIYNESIRNEDGKCTALDLNHKHHFCSSIDRILHECRAVEQIKKIIDDTNKTDLSSFELELKIGWLGEK